MKNEKQKELADFIVSVFPHIQKQISVLKVKSDQKVLHISKDKAIERFIPMVSNRTMKNEDRTVPRVCGAFHLWGCITGYSSVCAEFFSPEEDYHGGYYIYQLPVEVVGVPDEKLVPDAEYTGEVWVMGHNRDHLVVKPKIIGELFPIRAETSGEVGNRDTIVDFYLSNKESLELFPEQVLEPGYYHFVLSGKGQFFARPEQVKVSPISEEKYNSTKLTCTKGLSCESRPPSASW